jgi:2-dehydropantoate 2-reductase
VGDSASFSRIGVIGAGAVGCYYGARMAQAGADVRFLMRGDLEKVRARGSILIHDKAGVTAVRPVVACATPAEVGPVGLVVLALKTTSATAVRELVDPLLQEGTAILTLQNGLGADEYLAGLFGAARIMGGLVFMAVTRVGAGEVRCFHPGAVSVGEFGRPSAPRTHALAALLARAGMRSQVVEDLNEARWRKLVWNIPFNGLAIAEGGITTDRICGNPRLSAEARALMREVQRAAAGFGYTIPDGFVDKQFEVTPPMGAYQPSSLVDYLAGREVEVETIWGEPLRRAQGIGVAMPALHDLYDRLLAACRAPTASLAR